MILSGAKTFARESMRFQRFRSCGTESVRRWSDLNAGQRFEVDGQTVPDRNAEYLLYQTLVGMWPLTRLNEKEYGEFIRRIQQYMEKALKEAKLRTSWINPDKTYDRAVRDFIAVILRDDGANAFLEDFRDFVGPLLRAGMLNSLSQVLLKITSPGVPDIYQGCESWNFSLVDPDNRRQVDFQRLQEDLRAIQYGPEECRSALVRQLLRTPEGGRIKLYVVSRLLTYRRSHQELFSRGEYLPLIVSGRRKAHLVAFARAHGGHIAIAAAARFFLKLGAQ